MKKPDCLIGYTGFVGSTLLKQRKFDKLFRSTNVGEIQGKDFNLCICSAAPAQKWIANKEPDKDRSNIENIIDNLSRIQCDTFVLISTVDVFNHPIGVDERSIIHETNLHPYGLHRRKLEKFVESNFENHLIVRLPGLVGPGLKKNIIFDFLNNNNLSQIESRSVFQFYPMVNLWYDIQKALDIGLKLVHLTAEPVSVCEVALQGFGKAFENKLESNPVFYDFRTKYASELGGNSHYQYNKRESLQAIRAYAQSEPITLR
jgi:hypothetical protein